MAFSQTNYAVHSHNDYLQEFPLWKAYINGAASIEADVFLQRDTLFVTHSQEEISAGQSLENLYLKPLKQLHAEGRLRKLQLLIDIKSEPISSLSALIDLMKKYQELAENRQLSIVITGNRPKAETYTDYPDFILFDHQDLTDLETVPMEKVALISQDFGKYSVWNGLGRFTAADLKLVEAIIEKTHKFGKKIRFWATPDTRTAWSRFARLGVDFINTDQPAQAVEHLNSLDARSYRPTDSSLVYKPAFTYDTDKRPDNIILMIGDGNGLSQISAATIANGGALSLTQLNHLGLIKTSSYDDLITDSAAGATAMATGQKTNNRAIGTAHDGNNLNTIPEILSKKNFINALITTDRITGATPSSFFAHVAERENSEQILEDLTTSPIDFFIAAGGEDYLKIKKAFDKKEISDFNDLEGRSAIYFSENSIPTVSERGTLFPQAVKTSLQLLNGQSRPYFLMIEAAKIDSYGHSNTISGIVEEMLDFDKAISEVLKAADEDGNTLVLITADHETSGLGILQGDQAGTIEAGFLTHDHTGTMIPIFAYGPGAESFTGVYENNIIFSKILEVLDINSKVIE